MKIHLSVLVRNLITEKRLTNYNANIIPIKTGSFIKITDPENYKEANLHTHYRLVRKLIYFLYSTILDIVFIIEKLNRYNTNARKDHFQVVKRVVRYLKKTIKMGLTPSQESIE